MFNRFFFAEYYVAAVMLCVFGGYKKEWIDSNPEDAIYIYIHTFF